MAEVVKIICEPVRNGGVVRLTAFGCSAASPYKPFPKRGTVRRWLRFFAKAKLFKDDLKFVYCKESLLARETKIDLVEEKFPELKENTK